MVTLLEERGSRVLRTDACPVLTSPLRDPRAPHGCGAFPTRLAAE